MLRWISEHLSLACAEKVMERRWPLAMRDIWQMPMWLRRPLRGLRHDWHLPSCHRCPKSCLGKMPLWRRLRRKWHVHCPPFQGQWRDRRSHTAFCQKSAHAAGICVQEHQTPICRWANFPCAIARKKRHLIKPEKTSKKFALPPCAGGGDMVYYAA